MVISLSLEAKEQKITLPDSFTDTLTGAVRDSFTDDLPDSFTDTLTGAVRDSLVLALNLEYLSGIEEYRTPFLQITVLERILEIDSTRYNHWFNLAREHIRIHEYQKAIGAFQHGLHFFPDKENPSLIQVYISLSFCFNKTARHQLEKKVLDRAAFIDPDHPGVIGRYIISAHSRVRYNEAAHYRDRLIRILRKKGLNESQIANHLGKLYLNTDYLVAEKYFRTALQYDPENVEIKGHLAWVLIQNALKINEGMELMQKVRLADPDNPVYLHQQGYGLYLRGQLAQAHANLQAARDQYQQYSFELENHVRMVEEAIAKVEE